MVYSEEMESVPGQEGNEDCQLCNGQVTLPETLIVTCVYPDRNEGNYVRMVQPLGRRVSDVRGVCYAQAHVTDTINSEVSSLLSRVVGRVTVQPLDAGGEKRGGRRGGKEWGCISLPLAVIRI